MKKFMKAIAFATVMCMLLSVVAFADSSAEIATAGSVTVIVEGATASTPIAFVVTDTSVTEAANITSTNIKDVAQTETTAEGTASITLGTGGLETVNVFYGYQNVGEKALMLSAALEVEVDETVTVTIVKNITDADIQAAVDASNGELPETDNDKAGALIATVNVVVGEGRVVKDMIWSIRHSGEKGVAYVPADDSLFSVLNGTVQIGLAFSNGNSTEEPVAITGLHAIVKTGVVGDTAEDAEVFSDYDFDNANRNN